MKNFDVPIDYRLNDVMLAVRATSFEIQLLWERWYTVTDWEQDSRGMCYTIGNIVLDDKLYPVNIVVFFYTINWQRVAFFDSISMITHHQWPEEWLLKFCPQLRERHIYDAQNFHNAIIRIEELTGRKIKSPYDVNRNADDVVIC